MAGKVPHPMTDKNILQALVKQQLVTKAQAREILFKIDSLKRRLEAQRLRQNKEREPDGVIDSNPVTLLDVLAERSLYRIGDNFKGLDEEAMYQALAVEWGLPYQTIDPLKLDLNLVTTTIPHSFARKHLIIPLARQNGELILAATNPFNREVFDDISRAIQSKVRPVVATKTSIIKTVDEFFGFKRSIAEAEHFYETPSVDLGNLEQYVKIQSSDELPANDHMIRMRIDGILHDIYRLPKNVHPAIVSRIKNLSRLNIAEKRRPQDGRIKTDKQGLEVEVRISTVPVAFGEKVVMRIMDPDVLFQDLELLGFEPADLIRYNQMVKKPDLIRYNQMVKKPHGIILDCGPTGSGKSTTLYSTLHHLSSPEINITTVEDPIEMVEESFNQIGPIEMVEESFNQIGVQPTVGVTFATILRNILRQDPDVIMIGEMRDLETAENAVQAALTGHLVLSTNAVQAALTGHLVLSTLHTNDSVSAITRLIDLGLPAFLIQNTMVGIISQRLLRRICPHCQETFLMSKANLKTSGILLPGDGEVELKRGKGCQKCRGTGYFGRSAVFEVMPYTPAIRRLTTAETDHALVLETAVKEGLATLRNNAIKKMLNGTTTYLEVLRVT